jgi:hypothetical protein
MAPELETCSQFDFIHLLDKYRLVTYASSKLR